MTDDPATGQQRRVDLRDGTHVLVRPIVPDDRALLVEGFERLSRRSRYLRFLHDVDALSEAQLKYFTEIDYDNHMAWIALDEDDPERPGIGVARYIRLAGEPDVAEAAVTVIDDYQGRGLGTLLLGILADSAVEAGIRVFRNYVLAENTGMLEIFADLGATERHVGHGVVEVDVPLPRDPQDLPDTPTGRVFKAVATRRVPALPFRFVPLFLRRQKEDEPDDVGDVTRGTSWEERPLLRDWLDAVLEPREPD